MKRGAWLKLLVAAIILAVVMRHVDLRQTANTIRAANLWLIAAAWLVAFSTYVSRAFVLWLVAARESTLTPLHALRVNLIGAFFAAVVPSAAANDVVRGWYLVPRFPTIRHAVAAVVVQRLLGLASLGVLVGAALMSVKPWWGIAAWVILAAGAAIGVMLLRSQSSGPLGRIAAALRGYQPRTASLVLAFVLAFANMVMSIAVYALAAQALHIGLPMTTVFLASVLAILGVFTPLTPAGLGVSEGAFVGTVVYLGGDADAAFAASAVVRLILMSISLLGGAVYVITPRHHAHRPD